MTQKLLFQFNNLLLFPQPFFHNFVIFFIANDHGHAVEVIFRILVSSGFAKAELVLYDYLSWLWDGALFMQEMVFYREEGMERLKYFHLFFQDFWIVFHFNFLILVIADEGAHEKLVVVIPVVNLFIIYRFYLDSQHIKTLFILSFYFLISP